MNILPKKRWHVRTRENIAKVRKDEQQAAEEAEEKRQRILKAEKEARTALLRQRARANYGIADCDRKIEPQSSDLSETSTSGHVNFFEELEEGKIVKTNTNAEAELEEKEKREKYEKQIGYLTYLGQDTVEATGNVPWYDKVPAHHMRSNDSQGEKNSKNKLAQDPLTIIRKYVPSDAKSCKDNSQISNTKINSLEYHSLLKKPVKKRKKKHKKRAKKHKKDSSSCSSVGSSDSENSGEEEKSGMCHNKKSLDQLRAERLKRETEERKRTEELLARLEGRSLKKDKVDPATPTLQQKYNSQYNPELAKQNYSTNSKNR